MDLRQIPARERPQVPTINISLSRTSSSQSRQQIESPVRPLSASQQLQNHELTPPLTPQWTLENRLLSSSGAPHSEFHNYLRAFYHFHPTSTVSSVAEESSITVPINQGDVILVHSIQPNGWADGTLLASGARGWLPTNYCGPYDHDSIHSLLNALTFVWEFLRGHEDGDVSVYARHDYVRGMVAGVRRFLERSNCLNRDSPLVQSNVSIRRLRKGLLGDLSAFVKASKLLGEVCHDPISADDLYDLLDDIILKAFKVVTRAVKFLDIWREEAAQQQFIEVDTTFKHHPLTPPVEEPYSAATDGTNEARMSEDSAWESSPVSKAASNTVRFSLIHSSKDDPNSDYTASRAIEASPAEPVSQASPILHKRYSMAHRYSYSSKVTLEQQTMLASKRLETAHDNFISFAGTFLGGHIASRTSTELFTATKESVTACKALMTVAEEVWERDHRRYPALIVSRDGLNTRIEELVQLTSQMFNAPETESEYETFMPDREYTGPIQAATVACVKAAGELRSLTTNVIERIGDFDYDPIGLGITDDDQITQQVLAPVNSSTSEASYTEKPLPPPPEPTARPPPPPPSTTSTNCSEPIEQVRAISAPRLSSETITTPNHYNAFAEPQRLLAFPSLDIDIPLASPIDLTPESPSDSQMDFVNKSFRGDSCAAESFSTCPTSLRYSETSLASQTSTRPSTPGDAAVGSTMPNSVLGSFGSLSECQSTVADESEDGELQFLAETHAHELVYNRDGNIIGGSLPALVERLTTSDSTPDVMFVNTFYLTFRLFTTPTSFAQALVDRYDYVGENHVNARPVRLRVYNVFKGWLESHWRAESDSEALATILHFATDRLNYTLPSASKRLIELTAKVSETLDGPIVPRLVSSFSAGKGSPTLGQMPASDGPVPNSIITKSQLNLLRNAKNGGSCSILDFDALELARQFTLIESRIFCSIQPEELLASEWTKKIDSKAVNVRAMSTLSTNLTDLVADTILHFEDPKKRAVVIKQWVKIAKKCLDLNNYDSLMAIMCSLSSSTVSRMKKTWDNVAPKTMNRLQELKDIFDVSKNHFVLRQRLQNHVAPCLPFVGLYLTDLTFVDAGNQAMRQVPGDGNAAPISVINFDKHVRTAKVIGDLQRFQIPYRLNPIPEMQDWMESQIRRVRNSPEANVQSYYRRSLLLEPRESHQSVRLSPDANLLAVPVATKETTKDKFDFWSSRHFPSALMSKEKLTN